MKKVLVCGPFDEIKRSSFKESNSDLDFLFLEKEKITARLVRQADAVIGNLPIELLKGNPNLEWVQLTSSGADAM